MRFFLLGLTVCQAAFLRTIFVDYEDDTSLGHFEFGRSIGEAVGDVIRRSWAYDVELERMERWVESETGKQVYNDFVATSNISFPLYMNEVEGMAAGAGVPLKRFLVNQLREEFSQWVSTGSRQGHCTDAYAVNETGGATALGHNDDWGVYWRNATYFVIATALDINGAAKFRFGSWVYPGYLPGMQMNWNSRGLIWTVNSLFPKSYRSSGVGTAWVARHMAEASSIDDLVARAADPRVSTAMNYNLGNLHLRQLWNLEVTTGGEKALRRIREPYVHTNQFKVLDVDQFAEPSSDHRQKRWGELKPNDIEGIRAFLSDRKDEQYPVWRNKTGGDDCFTEVTGLFDLERRTLAVWTTPALAMPLMELSLDFAGGQSGSTLVV